MNVLYCRVGWNIAYRGLEGDPLLDGGAYNKENIGYEIYNYLGFDGKYYGFVEPGKNCTIHVERLGAGSNAPYAEGILVVWVAKNGQKGQKIIGWYKNATVYRDKQRVPDEVMNVRENKEISWFNIFSENVTLLDVQDRTFSFDHIGQKQYKYGYPDIDQKVIEFIDSYDMGYNNRRDNIEKNLGQLIGYEKESVIKARVNQDVFRNRLLDKYRRCCLCGVSNPRLLLASHIKPWSESDNHEKLDINNGLLLCPNHDKLFDQGLISFSENGNILISSELDDINKTFTNVNPNMKIDISDGNREYIRYHRENIYRE